MIGDTIVVVDDEPALLDVYRDVLEDEGYRVVPVAHPIGLDSALEGHTPSLFLIDIMLPTMSGIALAEHLSSGEYATTPMVGMSASGMKIQAATQSGWFASVIEKPFDLGALVGCLAACLNGASGPAMSDASTAPI